MGASAYCWWRVAVELTCGNSCYPIFESIKRTIDALIQSLNLGTTNSFDRSSAIAPDVRIKRLLFLSRLLERTPRCHSAVRHAGVSAGRISAACFKCVIASVYFS